jgi:phage baseplate assembly protein W
MLTNKVPFAFRRDIPWNFDLDDRGDLKMKEDIDAVNQSIYAILMSNFGDKNFEPIFGSDMESVVFEQSYPPQILAYEIESKIRKSIEGIEPQLRINTIDVNLSQINNYKVTVTIAYLLDDGLTQGVFDETLSFEDLSR